MLPQTQRFTCAYLLTIVYVPTRVVIVACPCTCHYDGCPKGSWYTMFKLTDAGHATTISSSRRYGRFRMNNVQILFQSIRRCAAPWVRPMKHFRCSSSCADVGGWAYEKFLSRNSNWSGRVSFSVNLDIQCQKSWYDDYYKTSSHVYCIRMYMTFPNLGILVMTPSGTRQHFEPCTVACCSSRVAHGIALTACNCLNRMCIIKWPE